MSKHVPTSTHWVTFPSEPKSKVLIDWTDDGHHHNVYYVTKCYWGTLPPTVRLSDPAPEPVAKYTSSSKTASEKNSSEIEILEQALKAKGVNVDHLSKEIVQQEQPRPRVLVDQALHIIGETRIFIAAEFVEDQYRGGPMLPYHIKDLTQRSPDSKPGSWVTAQLDECFHYGQYSSGDTLNRWLAYHPSISKGIPSPRMFQHRFTGLPALELTKTVAGELPGLAPDSTIKAGAKLTVKLAEVGTNVMKRVAGHYLHPFLNAQKRAVALYLQRLIEVDPPKDSTNKTTTNTPEVETAKIIAMQVIETLVAGRVNKKTEEGQAQRLKAELEYCKKLNTGINSSGIKKESWLDEITKILKSEQPPPSTEQANKILTDSNLSAGDGDRAMFADVSSNVTGGSVHLPPIDNKKAGNTGEQTEHKRPSFRIGQMENKAVVDAQNNAHLDAHKDVTTQTHTSSKSSSFPRLKQNLGIQKPQHMENTSLARNTLGGRLKSPNATTGNPLVNLVQGKTNNNNLMQTPRTKENPLLRNLKQI
ncbi:hypothetical protein B0H63DRAFT_445419 [Podospora didyma]|uniref:Uncharacterized protein n=1 Tax=Podospora didyma TaxID=330526 RepID=A0AAE0NX05_9PEZI|nr:hypothetical protein B0H63DRAFT_445419 [Podospora didyma]